MQTAHRIALVLNGGVSLAVWMGGTVQELNSARFVSAQRQHHPAVAAKATGSRAAWNRILQHAGGCSVAVDVIAGTSAGGLNGTLLAQAIALGSDLPALKQTWLDVPSLTPEKLLDNRPVAARWGFDEDYLGDEITAVMTAIAGAGGAVEPAPMTLLTTATAVNATGVKTADDLPDIPRDSRRVYRFRSPTPPGRPQPFGDAALLARAAMASASYPVAFKPPHEERLADYRQTPKGAPGDAVVLMDGGVLDNAPFEPLLDEMRRIPISGPWKRHLVYLHPAIRTTPRALPAEIDWFEELVQVVGISREPDARLDEEKLTLARNSRVNADVRPESILRNWLFATAPGAGLPVPQLTNDLFTLYVRTRIQWLRSRNSGMANLETLLARMAPAEPTSEPGAVADLVGTGADTILPPDWQWAWGLSVAERVSNWWGRVLNMVCRDDPAEADRPELQAAFSAISTLQQFVADANDTINAPARPNSVGHPADIDGDALLRFYDEEAPHLTALIRTAAEALATVIGDGASAVRVLDLTLRAEVLTATMSWGVDPVEWPIFEDHRLTPGQPPVLPEIEEYSRTKVASLPPWPANKLYGLRWWHFGAFATRSGREHDWVWGRVDGATALAGILIGTDPDARALTVDLVDAILAEEFGDTDVAANRRRLLEQTDRARRATTDELIAQMEGEAPGTVDHLKDTVVGLAASIPAETIRPWVVAALGHGNEAGAPTRAGLRAVYYALRTWGARRIDRELREWLKLPPRPTPWEQRRARLRGLVSRSIPRR